MHPRHHTLRACWIASLASLSALGCGGLDPLEVKERENTVLRFESERRRDSLIETLEEIARQRQLLGDTQQEKSALTGQITDLTTKLRTTTEQLTAATAQRDEARAQLADTQQSNDRLRDSVDKVREVASSSAGELAELRTKRKDLEDRNQALSKSEAALREETSRLSRQVRDLETTLQQVRAPSPNGADPYQQGLEREIAGLRGENFALQKRLEAMELAAGATPATAASAPGQGANAVYREDPVGLLKELGGLLVLRYERAWQGNIAWDGFDIAVVAVAGLLVILLLSALLRLCFGRRRRFKARVEEPAAAPVVQEDGAAEPAVESQPAEAAPRRPSTPRRRTGYPAIISAKTPRSEDDAQREDEGINAEVTQSLDVALEESPADDRSRAPARKPGTKTAKSAPVAAPSKETAPEPRRIIGARSWEPEESAASAGDQDDMASTQVIPSLSASGDDEPVPVAVVPMKTGGKPGAPSRTPPARPAAPAPAKTDDRELLQELKSVINRKFDELMK